MGGWTDRRTEPFHTEHQWIKVKGIKVQKWPFGSCDCVHSDSFPGPRSWQVELMKVNDKRPWENPMSCWRLPCPGSVVMGRHWLHLGMWPAPGIYCQGHERQGETGFWNRTNVLTTVGQLTECGWAGRLTPVVSALISTTPPGSCVGERPVLRMHSGLFRVNRSRSFSVSRETESQVTGVCTCLKIVSIF